MEIIVFCGTIGILFIVLIGILINSEQKELEKFEKELKKNERDIHKGLD